MAYDSDVKLANLDATVTSRLGAIVGIDRGTISIATDVSVTATATVAAVNTSRSILHYLGAKGDNSDARVQNAYLVLTNSTTISATTGAVASANVVVGYQLVEYAA